MKASIENPVVIAVIESEHKTYNVLDWGSNDWLDVQYKSTCYQFKKTDDLAEMMDLALTEMGCSDYAKESYKIKLI